MVSKKINYLDFFKTVGKSKRLLRTGWIENKINDPESVAEHSFRTGVIAMVLSDKLGCEVDKEKLVKMALIHDIAEVATGDTIIERGEIIDLSFRDTKEEQERLGIKQIFNKIQEGDLYGEIFEEMMERKSLEAKIFWQFDKLEMALTAFEYEQEQGKDLEEFFIAASKYMSEPLLKKIFENILKSRSKKY